MQFFPSLSICKVIFLVFLFPVVCGGEVPEKSIAATGLSPLSRGGGGESTITQNRTLVEQDMVSGVGAQHLPILLAMDQPSPTTSPPPPKEKKTLALERAQGDNPAIEEDQKATKSIALQGDDERLRSDAPFQTTIGESLFTLTGAFSQDFLIQNNLDLDPNRKRDRYRWTSEMALNATLLFSNGIYIFSELGIDNVLTFENRENPGEKPNNDFTLELKDAWVEFPLPLSYAPRLRVGRQQFFEPRRWAIDETLDAIRLLVEPGPFHLSLSVSTPPVSKSDDDNIETFHDIFEPRQQIDYIQHAWYDITRKSRIGQYVIVRDHDLPTDGAKPGDEDAIWVGFRVFGRENVKLGRSDSEFLKNLFKPRIHYWFDGAFVGGSVGGKKIRGIGFDLGGVYNARKLPFSPYATLGYAFGSGDGNSSSNVDLNFRQTGFHDNSGKFGGVVNFPYYGTVLNPELSNLQVFTAGFGFRPTKKSSFDIVYHHYLQNVAMDSLRDLDLRSVDPNGKDTNIGDEIDFIIGIRDFDHVRYRVRSGYFIPGTAFDEDERDPAFEVRLDIQFFF